jgi:hypothetical protein
VNDGKGELMGKMAMGCTENILWPEAKTAIAQKYYL